MTKNKNTMIKTRSQISSDRTSLAKNIALFLHGFIFRFFIRLASVPALALVAAPWIFIIFIEPSGDMQLQRNVFTALAWLSGKPSSDYLDEGDIGRAAILLFLIVDIILEVINFFRKKRKLIGLDHYKRRLITVIAFLFVGWILFSIKFFDKFGIKGIAFAILTGVISATIVVTILSFKFLVDYVLDNAKIN